MLELSASAGQRKGLCSVGAEEEPDQMMCVGEVEWAAGGKEKLRQRCQQGASLMAWEGAASHGLPRGQRAANGSVSMLTFTSSCCNILSGGQGAVVVLLLQINRVPGHHFLCFAEKNQSDYFSSRIPSCLHV